MVGIYPSLMFLALRLSRVQQREKDRTALVVADTTMKPSRSAQRCRRKQHGRAPSSHPQRRKQKKQKTNGIEEQLRLQRSKRRSNPEKTQERQPPPALGNYRYDEERNTYFPADSFPNRKVRPEQTRIDRLKCSYAMAGNARCMLDARAISSQTLRYSTEVTSSPVGQRDLRSIWGGRLIAMGMKVVPTCAKSADGAVFRSMLPPLRTEGFMG